MKSLIYEFGILIDVLREKKYTANGYYFGQECVCVHETGQLSGKKQIYQILWLELLSLGLIGLILLIFQPIITVGSFFVGGLVCLIPNVYQAKCLFKENYASAAPRIVKRLYLTELLKFASVATVFIVLMHWVHLNVLAFVSGFLLMEMGTWMLMPILMKVRGN